MFIDNFIEFRKVMPMSKRTMCSHRIFKKRGLKEYLCNGRSAALRLRLGGFLGRGWKYGGEPVL